MITLIFQDDVTIKIDNMPIKFTYQKILYILLLAFFIVTNSFAIEHRFTLNQDKNNIFFEIDLTQDQIIYWLYPGNIGLGSKIDLTEHVNVSHYNLLWPFPKQSNDVLSTSQKDKSYYYQGKVTIPLYVVPLIANEPVFIKAHIEYVLCSNQCELINQDIKGFFNILAPHKKPSNFIIDNVSYANNQLKFIANFSDIIIDKPLDFIINHDIENIIINKKIIQKTNNSYEVILNFTDDSNIAFGNYEIHSNHAELPSLLILDQTVESTLSWHNLLKIALFAIMGGFILNFMPCVLPVLSLKLLAFIKHPNINRRLACLFTILGIVTSFWILALIAISLKGSGEYFGLGLNFRNPEFIIVLTLIITIFISSTLGRININIPLKLQNFFATLEFNNLPLEYFFTGIFATILSTPCNAPFLGTALSLSLSQDTFTIFFTFTFIAIGFSGPYFLLMIRPNMIQFLPKSSPKTMWIYKFLAILLVLTLLWLLDIFANQMNIKAAILLAGCALLLKFILEQQNGLFGIFAVKITTIIIIIILSLNLPQMAYLNDQRQKQSLNEIWQDFDETMISHYVRENKIVFVDITADWCITCKYNKFLVLDREKTLRLLAANNVIAMRGDLTNHNAAIDQYLFKNKVPAIPYNIIYGPKAPQGIILPILVKYDDIKSAIEQAKN